MCINDDFMDIFGDVFGKKNALEYDVIVEKDSLLLQLMLPGFNKEDVKINIDNGVLYITGKRIENKNVKYRIKNTFYGEFSKKFNLGEEIDEDNITASHNDGVLSLTIPILSSKKKRKTVNIK